MSDLKDKHKEDSRNSTSPETLEISGIVDSHNHCTEFSPDASQTLDQLISEARAKGLGGFALTDHYDKDMINSKLHRGLSKPGSLPAEGEWIFDIDRYFEAVNARQAALQEVASDIHADQPGWRHVLQPTAGLAAVAATQINPLGVIG